MCDSTCFRSGTVGISRHGGRSGWPGRVSRSAIGRSWSITSSVMETFQTGLRPWWRRFEWISNSRRQGGCAISAQDSRVAGLLGGAGSELTGHFYRALERRERIRLDDMERFLPEDTVVARVRSSDGTFKPIMTGSVGQRSTAILSLLLSAGDQPLLIDQPEDDLDNSYVYDVVVSLLRHRKFYRQIVIATHNANIPMWAVSTERG